MKAEKEVERLSRQVRPKERSRGLESDRSAERTQSMVRASKSDTNQSDKKKKKKERSRSESRVKDMAHRSLSEAKDKLKKQAAEAASKIETGKKLVNGVGKMVEMAKGAKEVVKALKDGLSGDEFEFEDYEEEIETALRQRLNSGDSEAMADDIDDLGRRLQQMEISPVFEFSNKRERDDASSDSPPRKIKTPDPRPLSAINEIRDEYFVSDPSLNLENDPYQATNSLEEDDMAVITEILQLSGQLQEDLKERDEQIEFLQASLNSLKMSSNKAALDKESEIDALLANEREMSKTIEKLKRDLAEAKSTNAKAEMHIQTLTVQLDDEQEEGKERCQELKHKLDAAKSDLADAKRENEKLQHTITSLKSEVKTSSDKCEKMDRGYKREIDTLSKCLEIAKEEARKLKAKCMEEVESERIKCSNVRSEMAQSRADLRRSTSTTRGRRIMAIDGEGSSSEEEEEESEEEEEERVEEQISSKALKPQEIKSLIDTRLVWPKYEEAHDHSDFCDRIQRAASRAMKRGIPKGEVATNLNVYIEKKLSCCRAKFDTLRGDEDEDPPLEEAMRLLRLCDPDQHQGGSKFESVIQAVGEEEESFMKRVTKRHDKHIIPADENERTRNIKRQFYKGLLWRPPGIEAAMATCMDLERVATTTRQMIEDSRYEESQRREQNTNERSRQRRLPGGRSRSFSQDHRHSQMPPRHMRQVAAVTDFEETNATDRVSDQQSTERAETNLEFQTDAIVCTNCRMIGAHYTRQCTSPPFCSICKREGHNDGQHGVPRGRQQQTQAQRPTYQWASGRSWSENSGRGSYRGRNNRGRGWFGNAPNGPADNTQRDRNSGYQQNYNGYQQNANSYRQNANGYQRNTNSYQQNANGYQQNANGYQQSANSYQQNATGYQQNASTYQQNANDYNTQMESAAARNKEVRFQKGQEFQSGTQGKAEGKGRRETRNQE